MDKIERKAHDLMRVRENRVCETCVNNSVKGCTVTPDRNSCIYNAHELWKPNFAVFMKLAERVSALK